MAETITDKTMDEIEILAKLCLTAEEKEKSRQEMQRMLDYVDRLNALDTKGVEPLTHLFPVQNGFREDVVCESTPREEILKNAPREKDGQFLVPKTIG
ncbi:MAG: Asp-tRNA(Asn)/Glu-tRNA(Gln) amidotransferase subunit GatC [Lachnospiraceae bacterium]|nr:Asp-tRNA(Asn)/Glu-tRNA(Gln) amidotransferase subunit GatC [Lachnospiraceae bacterium]